jgi:hypothetical protein
MHFSGSQRIATELALNHRRWRNRVRCRPLCVAMSAEHRPPRRGRSAGRWSAARAWHGVSRTWQTICCKGP